MDTPLPGAWKKADLIHKTRTTLLTRPPSPRSRSNARSAAQARRNTSTVFGGEAEAAEPAGVVHGRPSSAWRQAPAGYGRTGPGDTSGGIFETTAARAHSGVSRPVRGEGRFAATPYLWQHHPTPVTFTPIPQTSSYKSVAHVSSRDLTRPW